MGEADPVLLVAHSYTRYMGDLSGGQILKKVAQRALKLPASGEGLNFYQFEGITSQRGFKQLYRSRMNELELDLEAKQRIVNESNRAFEFNMMVGEQDGSNKAVTRRLKLTGGIINSSIRSSQSSRKLETPSKRKSERTALGMVMQSSFKRVISTSARTMQRKWVRCLCCSLV